MREKEIVVNKNMPFTGHIFMKGSLTPRGREVWLIIDKLSRNNVHKFAAREFAVKKTHFAGGKFDFAFDKSYKRIVT